MSSADSSHDDSPFFSAFRPEPREHRRWIIPAVLGAAFVGVVAFVVMFWPESGTFQVLTSRGVRRIELGSSEHQVREVLGRPFYSEVEGGRTCLKYGSPTLETPTFLVYTACFEGGRLAEMTHRLYTVEQLERAHEGAPAP